MNKKLILISLFALIAAGCVSIPQTVIKTPYGEFRGPKDMEIEGLSIRKETNGVVTISAKVIRSRNNPEVIGASTAQIEAHYNGAEKLARAAIETSAKVAKTP
jgi:hypothetical protein